MTPDQKAILALTAENERLRGLLREAKPVTVELVALLQATSKHLPASAPIDMAAAQSAMGDLTGWISRIDAALAGAADQPSASLTAQGDMGAAFGPADGSGKWYDTDPACQRKCGLCGQSVIKHIVPGEAHRHWAGSLGLICPTDPRLVTASPTDGAP